MLPALADAEPSFHAVYGASGSWIPDTSCTDPITKDADGPECTANETTRAAAAAKSTESAKKWRPHAEYSSGTRHVFVDAK